LKGIQEEFKGKTVTGKEIMDYMEKILGTKRRKLYMFYEAYLEIKDIPVLTGVYQKKRGRYEMMFDIDPDLNFSLPLAYTFDRSVNGDSIKWIKIDFRVKYHSCWTDAPTTYWGMPVKLTKKQFKSLRFNNDLYLYEVKISKASKK
jgi:hypothetical protein